MLESRALSSQKDTYVNGLTIIEYILLIFGVYVFFFVFTFFYCCSSTVVQIADFNHNFLPFTVGSLYIFISLCIAFTSSILQPHSTISVSILFTSVLNLASDRLAIYSSPSCLFSGALNCSFIWAIVLCLLDLAASLYLFLCTR